MTPPYLKEAWDFLGGPVVKNLPCHAGDVDSVPGLGRFRMPWGNHALQLRLDTVKLYTYISVLFTAASPVFSSKRIWPTVGPNKHLSNG